MDQISQLWESVEQEEAVLLATSDGTVSMRTVSSVLHQQAVLIFTDPDSLKYRQLKANPNCCIAVGGFFLETRAEFCGHTMLEANESLRTAYTQKFSDAFDENVEFGGRNAEFILLKPVRVKGWVFENGIPTGPFEHEF